jgi:hypothetical protein
VFWSFVWVRDSSEVLDDTFSCLLVESLRVSAFADLKWCVDEALIELKVIVLMNLLSESSVLSVWGDEGNEDDLT